MTVWSHEFRWKPDDAVPVVTPCPAVPPGWNRRTEQGKCCYIGKTPVLLACVSFWKHVICVRELITFPGMLTDMCWTLWASDEAMWLSFTIIIYNMRMLSINRFRSGLEERRCEVRIQRRGKPPKLLLGQFPSILSLRCSVKSESLRTMNAMNWDYGFIWFYGFEQLIKTLFGHVFRNRFWLQHMRWQERIRKVKEERPIKEENTGVRWFMDCAWRAKQK